MAAKRVRSWKLVAIPDDESGVRQFRVTRAGLTLLIGAASLLILYAAAETVLFWVVAKRAAEVEPLRARVRELESSGDKVAQLGGELATLKAYEQQIRRMMAGGRSDPSQSVPWDHARIQTDPSQMSIPPEDFTPSISNPVAEARGIGKLSFTAMDVPTLPPVKGYVTRRFSPVGFQNTIFHHGLDIATAAGTPVLAAADGLVLFSDWTYRYGNLIVLSHRSGYTTFYGHNQVLLTRLGQRVRQGEPIALVGNSGVSTAPHLHFEIWQEEVPVNPALLLVRMP